MSQNCTLKVIIYVTHSLTTSDHTISFEQLNIHENSRILPRSIQELGLEGGEEVADDALQLGVGVGRDVALGGDVGEQVGVGGLHHGHELSLELGDLVGLHLIEVAADAA